MSFSSFTSLHIFAQIAGCLSFKEAAEALHLTQSALSHRIRKLEQELGFQLFVRQTRRIALTPEGERLYRQVSRHFGSVCHEIEDIRHQALRGSLEIGSTPTFAQHWLVPRLKGFYGLHPELSLHLRSKGSRVDFALHPADLWIDYGDGHYPGLDEGSCRHHYSFTHYDAAISGARSGLGVAMGRYQLARDLVARGELIFPFDTTYHQGLGYHVVTRREFVDVPKVRAFVDWLRQEVVLMAAR